MNIPFLIAYIALFILCAPALANSPTERINNRGFPSVFQAWNRADNLPDESEIVTLARHDLVWHGCSWYRLSWDSEYDGNAESFTKESIEKAKAFRRQIEALNPNMIFIAEIRYRDAWDGFLPADSGYWMRDADGNRVPGWAEGGFYLMNYTDPAFQLHIANRAKAAIDSGAVDGILLDWWWPEDDARLALIQKIRSVIGDDALIIVNANVNMPIKTAPYINGLFMETISTDSPSAWENVARTLAWAEQNLRPPRINCLETWYHSSRDDLNLMRATTALSLTLSDGYCLFSDPNWLPEPDHLHNWYSFWDKEIRPGQKKLGKPVAPGMTSPDRSVSRDFEYGTVVYNPAGNSTVTVNFSVPHESVATENVSTQYHLSAEDGDIYVGTGGLSRREVTGPEVFAEWTFDTDKEGFHPNNGNEVIVHDGAWAVTDGLLNIEFVMNRQIDEQYMTRIIKEFSKPLDLRRTFPIYVVIRCKPNIASPNPDGKLKIIVAGKEVGSYWVEPMMRSFKAEVGEMRTYILNMNDMFAYSSDTKLTQWTWELGNWKLWNRKFDIFYLYVAHRGHDDAYLKAGDSLDIDFIAITNDFQWYLNRLAEESLDAGKMPAPPD